MTVIQNMLTSQTKAKECTIKRLSSAILKTTCKKDQQLSNAALNLAYIFQKYIYLNKYKTLLFRFSKKI